MKKIIIAIFLFKSIPLFAQTGSVEITVINVKESVGAIAIALYDNPDHWLKIASSNYYQKIDKEGFSILIKDIPIGKYAVSLFHDKNLNRELDKNFIGIPKEPFGFGNDAMGLFGPPGFYNSSIEITEGEIIKMKVTLKTF